MLTRRLITAYVVPFFAIAGCYANVEEDAASIGAALEDESGGMTMEDEAPAFGAEDELAELELLEPDPEAEDAMETDPEVVAMTSLPEAIRFRVVVLWGQIPGDPTNETPHDWSGVLATNRGAMLVRRPIAFEPETDRLVGRPDPRTLLFTSVTLPHVDGVVLEIIDPEPSAEQPIGLGYLGDLPGELGSESAPVTIPLAALLDGPVELTSDEAGNRMIALAQAQPIDPCAHGFTMGAWHRVADGRGRFMGRVVDQDGALIGHVRGIFGRRESGEQVFFGKYIALDGTFQGIFAGRYGDGHLQGRWITRDGERGLMGGEYRESLPGEPVGGHFVARWGEATCNLPL